MRFGAKLALRRLITAVMTVTPPPIVVRTMSKDGAAQLSISLQQIVADKPPKERTLLRVAVLDEARESTGDTVERLMGNKPEARFAFISERAAFAEGADLDI